MAQISMEQAKKVLDEGMEQAQELIKEPAKVFDLLEQLEEKLKDIPVAGTALANVPLMIAMIRSYITKEYTEVSPKVIAAMVSSLVYLLKGKDLIPDNIPILGHLDDIAVFAAAFKLCEPELNAFAAWRDQNRA